MPIKDPPKPNEEPPTTVLQAVFGKHPPEAKLTVFQQFLVWLVALGGALIGLLAVPSIAFSSILSDLSIQEKLGQTPLLTPPHLWMLGLSLLLAIFLSTTAGGVLKMATNNSPIQWSVYALLLSLCSLAAATYLIGEARPVFSGPGTKGTVWVMPWLGTIAVLLGWTLKAPWDRCAQIVSEKTTNVTGWLNKPDAFTRAVTSRIAALPLATMDVPGVKDRKAPLEPNLS